MRMRKRVTPPEIAPNVAPFLPPASAPTAVAIPAVAAIIKASRCHDRRSPPPHNTTLAFIKNLSKVISSEVSTPHAGRKQMKTQRSGANREEAHFQSEAIEDHV